MKKKTLALGLAAITGSILLFTACKKDDSSSDSNSTKIVGTWKQNFEAVDANTNNTLDASEKVNFTDYNVVTFNSNGTFTDSVSGSGFHAKLTGTYTVNGDYVTSIIPGFDTSAGKITQLDNTTFILQDTSAHPAEWSGFTKQ